jgi:MOSC domain-containing protein YiiM
MVSENVLREFQLQPGTLFENMVIEGLDVMAFNAGQRLKIADTVLEVTIPCDPCVQMDRIRRGLKQELIGRRGMFVKVIAGGTIRVGDSVVL